MPIKRPKTSYEEARNLSIAERNRRIGITTPPTPTTDVTDNAASPATAKSSEFSATHPAPPQSAQPAQLPPEQPSATPDVPPPSPPRSVPEPLEPRPSIMSAVDAQPSRRPKKVRASVFVKCPQPGVSKTFDKLASVYDTNIAMREILTRALDAFDRNPVFPNNGVMPRYPMDEELLTTTRTVSADIMAAARRSFDPLGIAKNHAVANYVMHVALAAFFENDRAS